MMMLGPVAVFDCVVKGFNMQRWVLIAAAFYAITWFAVERANAVPVTGFVDARANLYKASPTGGGDGFNPFEISFTPGAELELTFSSVSGGTHCCNGNPNGSGSANPDGIGGLPATNVSASGGISGISAPGTLFLMGAFADSSAGFGLAPASLNYNGGLSTSAALFAPELNQSFFIGDGLTGNGFGATQVFQIPDFADRLFLGFADAAGFSGAPNFFGDNTGGLTFAGDITDVSAVPVPAGLLLLLTSLAAFGVIGFQRRELAVA